MTDISEEWLKQVGVTKALSVRQPWAWLIVNRYKPYENRTWNTKFRGEVLIHASKAFDKAGFFPVTSAFSRSGARS